MITTEMASNAISDVINTAYIERLNATFHQRFAVRRAARVIGIGTRLHCITA